MFLDDVDGGLGWIVDDGDVGRGWILWLRLCSAVARGRYPTLLVDEQCQCCTLSQSPPFSIIVYKLI